MKAIPWVALALSALLNVALIARGPEVVRDTVVRTREVPVERVVEVPIPVPVVQERPSLKAQIEELRTRESRMKPRDYHHELLERVAADLGLGPRFVDAGMDVAASLAVTDAEYDAAVKQAYLDAGGDWTQARVPEELAARWEAGKHAATARLTAFLDLRDPKHQAFADEELRTFVWHHLSRSSFAWQ